MKNLLAQYAAYNIWANKLIIDALKGLPAEALDMPMMSSFKSIRETLYHTWCAEDIWLQRLMRSDDPIWAAITFEGNFEDACNNWETSSHDLANFIAEQDEVTLAEDLHYADRRGYPYTTPVYEVLHHIFNHATYHRGQLVTLMRTAGATAIPGTDFIGFVRLKK